jgi:hypothetical protein
VGRDQTLRGTRLGRKSVYGCKQIAPRLGKVAARPSRKEHLSQPELFLTENRCRCLDPVM